MLKYGLSRDGAYRRSLNDWELGITKFIVLYLSSKSLMEIRIIWNGKGIDKFSARCIQRTELVEQSNGLLAMEADLENQDSIQSSKLYIAGGQRSSIDMG